MSDRQSPIAEWMASTTEQQREQFAADVLRLVERIDRQREWDLWVMSVGRGTCTHETEDSLK